MEAGMSGGTSLYLFLSELYGAAFAILGLIALIWVIIVLSNTNTYLKLLIKDRKQLQNVPLTKALTKPLVDQEEQD
ncbi:MULTISPECIES: hypothetical protein [Paenibacillus]|uniref:Uncharacterized protein n=1 Tax=Paenibacillus xylanilyticus TaxID=248903 RepID=A0A7Y6EWN7_9BACL|nr:hypothetical protein [Paenibacillus xylanilyticus]NUU79507.1 hypothetical protein [Paenibacillus xylanilyticus]